MGHGRSLELTRVRVQPGPLPPGAVSAIPGLEFATIQTRALKRPTGAPIGISCQSARTIAAQARGQLAQTPGTINEDAFVEALIDWLDPHGLWSVAPDSPVASHLQLLSHELILELEDEDEHPELGCQAAQKLGTVLEEWVSELHNLFEQAFQQAPLVSKELAFQLAAKPAFKDGPNLIPAKELSAELGKRLGSIQSAYGSALSPVIQAAETRLFPTSTQTNWSHVILAAAVRAYIPQMDPHGAWAPYDEETSLYEIDLEASPPPRLYHHMSRTAVGFLLEENGARPMKSGELLLSVGSSLTAGLSVEQGEQLALVDWKTSPVLSQKVWVLGPNDAEPQWKWVHIATSAGNTSESEPGMEAKRVTFGRSQVLVIPIHDVPDNLGSELAATIARERELEPFSAILLDLRGNGGGSTEGAAAAIGLFLPGAPLFPLRRRSGARERSLDRTVGDFGGW
jgi:carboxyl-terminal processing protease